MKQMRIQLSMLYVQMVVLQFLLKPMFANKLMYNICLNELLRNLAD